MRSSMISLWLFKNRRPTVRKPIAAKWEGSGVRGQESEPKFEIPNPKSETNSKFEFPNDFEFGILDLFGIWDLGFRICCDPCIPGIAHCCSLSAAICSMIN